MVYKWQLNGYEMEYLSEPLLNHNDTITKPLLYTGG